MEVLSVAFVDFTRAFDEVRLEKLKEKLRKAGVEEGLIRWVEASLEKVRARVKGTSMWYPEDKGLKQGGPSGPSLYSVYTHDLPEEVGKRRGQRRQTDRQRPKVPAGENGRWVDFLAPLFADDTTLLESSDRQLNLLLSNLVAFAEPLRLLFSDKSRFVRFGRIASREKEEVRLGEIVMKEAREQPYLGLVLSANCNLETMMEARSIKAERCMQGLMGKIGREGGRDSTR
uniref:Reverse transcriptase domain-containing protein n=1 Tax=Chromera velia CCMP2878 TaxID=1169474 RepID=A0A0G4G4U1_9ALVE|eukprot:Cvel_20255.t1-p1 / transcript=Cvel_20255.t1 / gene=Cvel_20255 / organism=Chromera_velia_CCMP2878 / gene_product=hypothetical protein / transcript_product=hypothetical protein / location=Cvel_scaffold1806:30279-30965(-) / protein_length=229 / sequence_SO=supercontig / SO=protein_coding / is_pseudo=false